MMMMMMPRPAHLVPLHKETSSASEKTRAHPRTHALFRQRMKHHEHNLILCVSKPKGAKDHGFGFSEMGEINICHPPK